MEESKKTRLALPLNAKFAFSKEWSNLRPRNGEPSPEGLSRRSVSLRQTIEATVICAANHPSNMRLLCTIEGQCRSQAIRAVSVVEQLVMPNKLRRSVSLRQTIEATVICAANRPSNKRLLCTIGELRRPQAIRTVSVVERLVMPNKLLRRSVPAGQTYEATVICAANHPSNMRLLCTIEEQCRSQAIRAVSVVERLVMPNKLLRRSVPAGQTYEATVICAANHPSNMRLLCTIEEQCRPQAIRAVSVVERLVMPNKLLRRSVPAGQTYEATVICAANHPSNMRLLCTIGELRRPQAIRAVSVVERLVMPNKLLRRSVPAGQTYETG